MRAHASGKSAYTWSCVTAAAPFAPRDGAGALVYDDAMWLLGGWNPRDKVHFPKVCNNEVWRSTDGAEWTLEKPNTFPGPDVQAGRDWEGRHTAGYAVHRDSMWIVGGDPIQHRYQNDVWCSKDGRTWSLVNGRVPWGPRVLHYTVAFKDRLWVLGGQTLPQFAEAEERFYRDVWSSPDGRHWQKVEPKNPFWPQRGMIGGSVVFRGRIWILGGGTYNTPARPERAFFSDVWSSSDGVHWCCHTRRAPWPPRQYHEVAVFDGKMWVLEGYDRDNRNDVWFSADGEAWHEVPETPWAPRHAASVFVFDNALWMVAGNNMEPDVWKLTPA